MKTTKKQKTHIRREEVRANKDMAIAGCADNYLLDNPITYPLADYMKKMYAAAYILGETIYDI